MTNFEVKALLEMQQDARRRDEEAMPLPGARRSQSAATAWQSRQQAAVISEQVQAHLAKGSCAGQSVEGIGSFMAAVKKFDLTDAETLALVNTQPRSVVELFMLVEECEERLTAEQTTEILDLCQSLSGSHG